MDLALRLPAIYRQAEYEIRNLGARLLQRGKVDVFVNVESQVRGDLGAHQPRGARRLCRRAARSARGAGLDYRGSGWTPPPQVLMRLPDVVATEAETISDEEHAALLAAVDAACCHLNAFREQEGAILIADLLRRVDLIEHYKEEVVPFEKARTENIRARILDNLAKLPVDVDRNRLEQEMIFYLEKLDITEEKVRLTNHCHYFREVAAGEEGVGRKLGFIAQEMGREINTMGSKANEPNIQILVVKMKDELEKIKGTGTQYPYKNGGLPEKLKIPAAGIRRAPIFQKERKKWEKSSYSLGPSGSGKTTIVRELLARYPQLEFSISATSRAPRGKERDGVDYYFSYAGGLRAGRCRRALRRVGGGLQGHLLRHTAQRGRAHLGEGACDRLRCRRPGGHQPQADLRRRGLLDLHHAALDRGAAPTARRTRHGCSGGNRPPRGQGRIRTDESLRSSTTW